MIELLFIAQLESEYELKRFQRQREEDKKWHEEFMAASPEMKKIMLKVREEMRKKEEERKRQAAIERRHQEQIRAQERIAEAIRFSAILRS